jgi:L-ascorbate metabolism protein UlaG (beta-lactamase superfamily)
MGPDDSLRAIRLIRPKRVIPTHFGTWPVIAQDAGKWTAQVKAETIAEPIVLKPGQAWEM